MAKLTKREKIELQMARPARRDNTWVGIRPVVFGSRKYNKKLTRREGKALCREF